MDQDETKVKKMKYILYRSFGDLDKDIKKHELVAVEIGGSIDEVTNALHQGCSGGSGRNA